MRQSVGNVQDAVTVVRDRTSRGDGVARQVEVMLTHRERFWREDGDRRWRHALLGHVIGVDDSGTISWTPPDTEACEVFDRAALKTILDWVDRQADS